MDENGKRKRATISDHIHAISQDQVSREDQLEFKLKIDGDQLDDLMIQFPPEMDENWVRYGLAKLGQISRLPNWQKIVVLCVHNTTSALNS